ncbi:MAG: hypothetical protein HXY28_06635 [Hydrogenophilaceae bacterium]|jgi:hypothetical protein|nr:hypothetical protein [Hydrogenophilaceae bacterium]
MRNVGIVHVPGDEASAHDLAGRLAGRRALICGVGSRADHNLRFGADVPLIVIWSAAAAAADASEVFAEIAFQHEGPTLVFSADGAPLPDALDDELFRVIDLTVTGEALEAIQRSHDIVARAELERCALEEARFGARRAPKLGPALAGGMVTGFAASVALLSTVGVAAISVADQPATTETDLLAEARASNVRVLDNVEAPDPEAWMDMRPAAFSLYEAASVALAVQQAASQLPAGREAPPPEPAIARFERAADALWDPSAFQVRAPAPIEAAQLSAAPMLEPPALESFSAPSLPEIGAQLQDLGPLRLSLSDLGAPTSAQPIAADDAPVAPTLLISSMEYEELTAPSAHPAFDPGV